MKISRRVDSRHGTAIRSTAGEAARGGLETRKKTKMPDDVKMTPLPDQAHMGHGCTLDPSPPMHPALVSLRTPYLDACDHGRFLWRSDVWPHTLYRLSPNDTGWEYLSGYKKPPRWRGVSEDDRQYFYMPWPNRETFIRVGERI